MKHNATQYDFTIPNEPFKLCGETVKQEEKPIEKQDNTPELFPAERSDTNATERTAK